MRKNSKRDLYESIIKNIAKQVKKTLNESFPLNEDNTNKFVFKDGCTVYFALGGYAIYNKQGNCYLELNSNSKESPKEIAETFKNIAPNATKEEYQKFAAFIQKNSNKPASLILAVKNCWSEAKDVLNTSNNTSAYTGKPVSYKLSLYFIFNYDPSKKAAYIKRTDGNKWSTKTDILTLNANTSYKGLDTLIARLLRKNTSFGNGIVDKEYTAWIKKYLAGTKLIDPMLNAVTVKVETPHPVWADIIKDIKSGKLNTEELTYLSSADGASQLGHLLADGKISQGDYDYAWKCIKRGK